MNRKEVLQYALEEFGSKPEFLWTRYPGYCILRHDGNRKWYAAVMNVPKKKLGLSGKGETDILNVKCDAILLGSLRRRTGFLPAYHMNKSSWVSILLDGSVTREEIVNLLTVSYDLTQGAGRRR